MFPKWISVGLLASALLLYGSVVQAYRPFISTDAAVADHHEVEIEMGYFNFARTGNNTTWIVPQTVVNYGIYNRLETDAEFEVDTPDGGSANLMAPALDLKWVAKQGVLQDKPGDSIALNSSLLLPSTEAGQRQPGFEETMIWSHPLLGFMFHVNLGGGVGRNDAVGFLFGGMIAEHPLTKTLRVVGEIDGQSPAGAGPDNSGLVGFIWESPVRNLFLDAGARRGLAQSSADWQFTTGFTFAFNVERPKAVSKRESNESHPDE